MKNVITKVLVCLTIVSSIMFSSCSDTGEILEDLTISEKIQLLEKSEWLPKGFEDRVMYTFENEKRSTYYGEDGKFTDPIPGKNEYKIEGELFIIDLNFGNISTFDEVIFSCDNQIVKFYLNKELKSTLYKRNSNYKDCL